MYEIYVRSTFSTPYHVCDVVVRYNNVADEIMLEQMDGIVNPTLRERIERGIIRQIISDKAKFGLGHTTSKNCQRGVKKQRMKIENGRTS